MDEQRQFSGQGCLQEKRFYENCIQLKLFDYRCVLDKHIFTMCLQDKEKRIQLTKNKIEGNAVLMHSLLPLPSESNAVR